MRVFELVKDGDVVEFDVEVLIDGFEGAADGDVVFQLDGHGLVGEGFEEGEEEHGGGGRGGRGGCGLMTGGGPDEGVRCLKAGCIVGGSKYGRVVQGECDRVGGLGEWCGLVAERQVGRNLRLEVR